VIYLIKIEENHMSEHYGSGESSLPIIDRIMTAGRELGVSRREIGSEMKRLTDENDIAGMQTLFNAYKNWEMREREATVSQEVTEELAYRNFEA
jgi:hypothetical protein